MKSQRQLLILAVLLVLVIILVSVFSCSNFVPYSSKSLFSRYSKYEGFEANSTNVGSALVNDKPEEEEDEDDNKKVEGFEGLKPAPFNEDKPLDSFSKTPGSLECEKISSLSTFVKVLSSDLPRYVILNLEKGDKTPKNLDFGFLAPRAITDMRPFSKVNISAITLVLPYGLWCKRKASCHNSVI